MFAGTPPARILVEPSTESEWCARHLEVLGHEVVVAGGGGRLVAAAVEDGEDEGAA